MAKFSWNGYFEPTPKLFRKIGDAFLGVFSITSVTAVVNDDHKLAVVSLMIGVFGKLLTNFFVDEPAKDNANDQP